MRPWGPPRPPPPPNARRPAPGPNDQEDLQDQEGVRRRLTEAPTIRSTAGTAPRGRGNFYHANQRGNQNSSYPSYRKSAYERPNAEHTPSGHSGWEPRGSGAIDSLERETYSHSERPSDAANTGVYYHPIPSTPPRTHSSYTTSPSQGQRQHSTSSSDYNRSPWSRGVSNNYAPHAGSYPHQQFEPHSSTLAASSNYNPTSYQNKPTTPFSGKKRSYPPPSDQSAEAPPAKKPKPSSAMTSNKQDAGTISLLLPNRCLSGGKFSAEEIESNLKLWTEERLQPLIDGGKTIIRTYVE
ncbi:hypothetical protein DL93DRAFT_1740331 [Clavulina sp. PMI_390]|nr:hypothetical protein DL93DRAFT_1740331 [Clavulina sp. PMI_390]